METTGNIEKARQGIYQDTSENRRKHRVGQKYGQEGVPQEEGGEEKKTKHQEREARLKKYESELASIRERLKGESLTDEGRAAGQALEKKYVDKVAKLRTKLGIRDTEEQVQAGANFIQDQAKKQMEALNDENPVGQTIAPSIQREAETFIDESIERAMKETHKKPLFEAMKEMKGELGQSYDKALEQVGEGKRSADDSYFKKNIAMRNYLAQKMDEYRAKYPGLSDEQLAKVHDARESDDKALAEARTIFMFSDQRLLNLFENEIIGQISDGMWENSRGTDWAWKNVAYVLGPKTQVFTSWLHPSDKKSFPLGKALIDAIGYRIAPENGFASFEDAKAAWGEINSAIKGVTIGYTGEIQKIKLDASARRKDFVSSGKRGAMEVVQMAGFKKNETYPSLNYYEKPLWVGEKEGKVRIKADTYNADNDTFEVFYENRGIQNPFNKGFRVSADRIHKVSDAIEAFMTEINGKF